MDEQSQHIERILHLSQHIREQSSALGDATQQNPWLANSLTMQQFKTLFLAVQSLPQGTTVGSLAKRVGVGLPTMSGIIDRLYEQKLLTRYEDDSDRRITRILPTEEGTHMISTLRSEGLTNWRTILHQLDEQELSTVEQAFKLILEAIERTTTD
jgi:DNA-binding MarR family transcriptional regulator